MRLFSLVFLLEILRSILGLGLQKHERGKVEAYAAVPSDYIFQINYYLMAHFAARYVMVIEIGATRA